MVPVIYWALELTRSLYAMISIPALPASAWEGVPWPLLLFISLAVKDLADYWNHRLMHIRWIWPHLAAQSGETNCRATKTGRTISVFCNDHELESRRDRP